MNQPASRVASLIRQYWSVVDDERPNSSADCYNWDTGWMDDDGYRACREKEEELEVIDSEIMKEVSARKKVRGHHSSSEAEERTTTSSSSSQSTSTSRAKRSKKSLAPYYFDENG